MNPVNTTAATPSPEPRSASPSSTASVSQRARFDSALRRAQQDRDSDDSTEPSREESADDGVHENLLATLAPAVRPPQPTPSHTAPAGLAQLSLTAQSQASHMHMHMHMHMQSAAAPVQGAPSAWSVQMVEPGLPIAQLHLQRATSAAPLTVQLSLANNVDSRRLPLDRLRERLAAQGNGQATPSVSLHTPVVGNVNANADDEA